MRRYVITIQNWFSARLDTIGMGLSGLCALHCLALPLLLSSGVLFTDADGPDDPTHLILFALAGPVGLLALWRGYRHHRVWQPLAFGCIGIVILWRGLFQGDHHATAQILTLVGAGTLALSHLYNWRRHVAAHAVIDATPN